MIDSGNEKKVQELAKPEVVNVPDDRGGYTSLHHAALKGKKGQPPTSSYLYSPTEPQITKIIFLRSR